VTAAFVISGVAALALADPRSASTVAVGLAPITAIATHRLVPALSSPAPCQTTRRPSSPGSSRALNNRHGVATPAVTNPMRVRGRADDRLCGRLLGLLRCGGVIRTGAAMLVGSHRSS
jgi:hypothetical protein